MSRIIVSALFLVLYTFSYAQSPLKSWEGIKSVGVEELRQNFTTPPSEYASHILWGWDGDMNQKIIKSDLDLMQSVGTRVVNIEPGYDFPYEYLSDGWFKMIKMAVKEADKRGMKVWLIDDAKYAT